MKHISMKTGGNFFRQATVVIIMFAATVAGLFLFFTSKTERAHSFRKPGSDREINVIRPISLQRERESFKIFKTGFEDSANPIKYDLYCDGVPKTGDSLQITPNSSHSGRNSLLYRKMDRDDILIFRFNNLPTQSTSFKVRFYAKASLPLKGQLLFATGGKDGQGKYVCKYLYDESVTIGKEWSLITEEFTTDIRGLGQYQIHLRFNPSTNLRDASVEIDDLSLQYKE